MSLGVSWDADQSKAAMRRTRQEYLRQAIRRECLCGGHLTAVPYGPDVPDVVRRHQRTPRHREWFAAAGWFEA